jgi:hypothetical protein
MSLSTPVNGGTVQASDISQLVKVLQETSGSTEVGKYYLQGGGNVSGWVVSNYMVSLSRTSVPVSVSIDTADQAPAASAGTPTAIQLTFGGFQVQFAVTAVTNTARAAGNSTIHF